MNENYDTHGIRVWVDAERNLRVEECTEPQPEPEYAWTA